MDSFNLISFTLHQSVNLSKDIRSSIEFDLFFVPFYLSSAKQTSMMDYSFHQSRPKIPKIDPWSTDDGTVKLFEMADRIRPSLANQYTDRHRSFYLVGGKSPLVDRARNFRVVVLNSIILLVYFKIEFQVQNELNKGKSQTESFLPNTLNDLHIMYCIW